MKNYFKSLILIFSILSGAFVLLVAFYFWNKYLKNGFDQKKLERDIKRYVKKIEKVKKELKNEINSEIESISNRIESNLEESLQSSIVKTELSQIASPKKSAKKKVVTSPKSAKGTSLNERQSELLNYISIKGSTGMSEISQNFGNVSERTLRRDMDKLESLGKVVQLGRTKNSTYKLS